MRSSPRHKRPEPRSPSSRAIARGAIYAGYFRDPDGHLWEILWNPELEDI